jgi:hypothetical protein
MGTFFARRSAVPATIAPDPALTTTAAPPAVSRGNVPRSAAAFLAMMAALVVIKMIVARFFADAFVSPAQAIVFSWPWIGGITVLGLAGTWCASRTGFPETWSPDIPLKDRLAFPIAAGIALGALAILVDALTGWSALAAQELKIPTIQIRFPGSLVIYPGAAIIVNSIYYLVLLAIPLWLVMLVTRGRWQREAFVVVGVLSALLEPLSQDLGMRSHPGIAAITFAQDFALNLAQVFSFRRAGFASSVVLRVAFYLVWHVLWGALRA